RFDGLQLLTYRLQTGRFNDASVQSRFIAIVLKNVPAAEYQIVKRCKRHEVLDQRAIMIRALPQTNGAVLAQAAYRSPPTFFNEFHTGDDGRADCSRHGEEDTQLPAGRGNRHLLLLHIHSPLVDRSMSQARHERRDSKLESFDHSPSPPGMQTAPGS